MRSTHKILIAAGGLAAGLFASPARAQIDVNPPMPNVLLLVDTSGSMDYQIDGSKVACPYVDPTLTGEPTWTSGTPVPSANQSRWSQLVQVLTGDVTNYSCYSQDRSSANFITEYQLGAANVAPYDKGYYVPFHRILSGTCTMGPGVPDANTFSWGTDPFHFHAYNNPTSGSGSCTALGQTQTGLLDSFADRARFALMTFDPLTDPGTGLSSPAAADYPSGTTGAWSYFLDWQTNAVCGSNASCAKGKPGGCQTTPLPPMEVGARNPAAPPWEGRLVPFGDPTASLAAVQTQNQRIQNVLLAMRPYGATPINGMMADARDFLLNDGSADLSASTSTSCSTTTGVGCFGPKYDPYINSGCRKNFVILLTDGEPNLDLRPWCEQKGSPPDPNTDGICPYPKTSEQIAYDLASSPTNPTMTFVVGFAVSSVAGVSGQPSPVDCSQISSSSSFDPKGLCGASMDPKLSACCALAKIAWNGGTTNAHFATDINGLRSAVSDILSSIASTSTTRTLPVFGAGPSSSDPFAASYSFLSSFVVASGQMWKGVLERKRTVCQPQTLGGSTTLQPVDQDIDPGKGDNFADNLNSGAGMPRHYYTTIRTAQGGGTVNSQRSVRPNLVGNPDGVNAIGGDAKDGDDSGFPPLVPATAMNVLQTNCGTLYPATSDDDCAHRFMSWEIGAVPSNPSLPSRVGNKLGDVYHSTPSLVAVPNDHLRDESYIAFAAQQALRPAVLYTATNDGQLHAFKVNKNPADTNDTFPVDSKTNNELWSFFPPAVLPDIAAQYSSTHQRLLDGVPVIKDVVFQRSLGNAEAGAGGWHTVIVAGFGTIRGGYYAVDITNPVPKTGDANSGPKLLWQLTTDDAGTPLFGAHGGTPSITTLYFNDPDDGLKEYAVAILPGGDSDGPAPYSSTCGARSGTWTSVVDANFPARGQVNCYSATAARSVTIVRLDNGKIIRSFRRQGDPTGTMKSTLFTSSGGAYAKLDSPMTGQPVVFPATAGAVAQRAFIGDRDGALWRMDFSSTNPRDWQIELFFDAYTGKGATVGQPIATPPILSVDEIGNVTLAFSTGDQETFTADPNMTTFVWSVRENAATSYKSDALWYLPFANGERVTGPMSIFSSTLYFSSFLPNQAGSNVCSAGSSKIWGLDYLHRKDDTTQPSATNGPLGRLTTDLLTGNPVSPSNLSQDLGQKYLVFGVGIRQRPSCAQEDPPYTDPYLGYGAHTGMSSVTPGTFELVVQTGTGGTSSNKAITNTLTAQLPTPPATTRIDSWAAVVE